MSAPGYMKEISLIGMTIQDTWLLYFLFIRIRRWPFMVENDKFYKGKCFWTENSCAD